MLPPHSQHGSVSKRLPPVGVLAGLVRVAAAVQVHRVAPKWLLGQRLVAVGLGVLHLAHLLQKLRDHRPARCCRRRGPQQRMPLRLTRPGARCCADLGREKGPGVQDGDVVVEKKAEVAQAARVVGRRLVRLLRRHSLAARWGGARRALVGSRAVTQGLPAHLALHAETLLRRPGTAAVGAPRGPGRARSWAYQGLVGGWCSVG